MTALGLTFLLFPCPFGRGRAAGAAASVPEGAAAELRQLATAPSVSLAALEVRQVFGPADPRSAELIHVRVHPIWSYRALREQWLFAVKPAEFQALGVPLAHGWQPEKGGDPRRAPHPYLVFSGTRLIRCFPVAGDVAATPWGRHRVPALVDAVRLHGPRRPGSDLRDVQWGRAAAARGGKAALYPLVSPSGRWVFFERMKLPERQHGFLAMPRERELVVCDLRGGGERLLCSAAVSRCLSADGDRLFFVERAASLGASYRLRRYEPDSQGDKVIFSWDVRSAPRIAVTPDERPRHANFLMLESGDERGGELRIVTLTFAGKVIARLDGHRAAETADGTGLIVGDDGLGYVIDERGKPKAVGRISPEAIQGSVVGPPLLLPNRKQLGYNVHRCHGSAARHQPDGSRWERYEAHIVDLDGSHHRQVLEGYERVTLRFLPAGAAVAHCWGLGGARTDLFFPLVADKKRPGYVAVPEGTGPLEHPPTLAWEPKPVAHRGWRVRSTEWGTETGRGTARIAAVDPQGWSHYVRPPDGKGYDFPADLFHFPPAWIPGRTAFVAGFGRELWLCQLRTE